MSKAPAFQLYAADFYMDTVTWSCEQVGAYLRLLLYEWINGPLDPDPKVLAGICGIPIEKNWKRTWERIWLIVGSKFAQNRLINCSHLAQYNPDFLSNKRLELEREKQINNSEIQRNNVNKRWMKHDTAVIPSNKIGNTLHSSSSSNINNNPPTPRKRGMEYADDFLSFWAAYPKKVGKDAAWRVWRRLTGTRPALAELVTAIQKQTQSDQWQKEGGQFIPHPATWLNQGRWADETEVEQESQIDAWARKKKAEMEEQGGTV